MSLRTVCKCGHEKDTHFDKTHSCLSSRCDCKRYLNEDLAGVADRAPPTLRSLPLSSSAPDPSKNKPHAKTTCDCDACQAWERAKFNDPDWVDDLWGSP